MWEAINSFLTTVDNLVWGVPLMVLIMAGGILLTARLGLLQMRRLPLALKWMFKNEAMVRFPALQLYVQH